MSNWIRNLILIAFCLGSSNIMIACAKKNIKNPQIGAALGAGQTPSPTEADKAKKLEDPAQKKSESSLPKTDDQGSKDKVDSSVSVKDEEQGKTSETEEISILKKMDSQIKDSKLTEIDSDYEKAELDSEHLKVFALAALDRNIEKGKELTDLQLNCYNSDVKSHSAVPASISLLPQSELLIEVAEFGSDSIATLRTQFEKTTNTKNKYLVTSCFGDSDKYSLVNFSKDTKNYDIHVLTDDVPASESIRSDSLDRSKLDVTIVCHDQFAAAKDMKASILEKEVMNRINLNKNSRIILTRPMNFILKNGKKFSEELQDGKAIKPYVVYVCQ